MILSTIFFEAMTLNHIECLRAQDLLLQLVEVISPFADLEIPSSFQPNKRFFIAPSDHRFSFDHSVHLLSRLSTVQAQVEEMIETNLDFSSNKPLSSSQAELEMRGKAPFKREASTNEKEDLPLVKQAQEFIKQVRQAIGTLCHSNIIKNPQEVVFKETLRKLKPSLDQIIQKANQESSKENKLPPAATRPFIPRSSREEFVHQISSPLNFQKGDFLSTVKSKSHEDPIGEQKKAPLPSLHSERLFEKSLSPEPQVLQLEGAKVNVRHQERTTLPIPVFLPLQRELSPTIKKKKKKGFWFQREEEPKNS